MKVNKKYCIFVYVHKSENDNQNSFCERESDPI